MRQIRLAVCLSMLAATLGIMGGPPAVQAVALVPAVSGSVPQRHVESWGQLPADLGRAIHLSIPGTAPTTFQTRLTGGPAVQGRAGFGAAVALDATGTIALVGASFATGGKGKRTGAAYVFTRRGSTWTLQARLTPGRSGERGAGFGLAVALDASGTTAVVGAPQTTLEQLRNAGAAYVFTRHGSTWTRQARLTARSSARGGASFGSSVALDGAADTVLIGAANEKIGQLINAGAAYVFTRHGSTWIRQARLTAESNIGNQANFGQSVAIDRTGATALIGAPLEELATASTADNNQLVPGAAYVFARTGSVWTPQARLTTGSSTTLSCDQSQSCSASFGRSVALDSAGAVALIGVSSETVGWHASAGAAYVFTTSGTG